VRKEILYALAGLAGLGMLIYALRTRAAPAGAAAGAMGVEVRAMGGEAMASAICKVTGGTPPITADMYIEVRDYDTGTVIGRNSRTCTGLDVNDTCQVSYTWTYTPGKTYEIYAYAILKNAAGSRKVEDTRLWTAPAIAPMGEISIEVVTG